MSDERTELEIVRQQLAEAHATLDAIRCGEVDAVMVDTGDAHEVFTLQPADLPYREFLERMAEGALSLDADGLVLYCNQFLCGLLGLGREQLTGRPFSSFVLEGSRSEFEAALAASDSGSVAVTLRGAGERRVPVLLSYTPVGGGERRRTNLVVSDQRIRRRLQTVSAARDAAEAASTAKDRFLAVLGHELRNPLAALTSSVELLAHGAIDDQRRDWIHDSMARQLAQLRSLVDDLLDVTRIAQGKMVLRKAPVDIASVVADALESVSSLVNARKHTLVCEPIVERLEVFGDRTRLEQVIVNLVANAANYTEPGGRIELSARREGEHIRVEVVDTGVGIDAADIEHIFEPFAQVGEAGSGGLGIGLTLVRQLVELHGGTVEAESGGHGQGTTFRVSLPQGGEQPAPEPRPNPGQLPRGLRVVVVDDNEDSAQLMALLLAGYGLEVESVHRGTEVLPAVERHRAKLVLLDLGLPDISGYEVAQQLRQAGHDELVIVALTGFSHASARQRAEQAGCDAHAVKPLKAAQLATMVARFHERLKVD